MTKGMTLGVTVRGTEQLRRVLAALGPKAREAMAEALTEEAEAVMDASKQIVPYEFGNLEASGQVGAPEVSGTKVRVRIGYGNSAVRYAIVQHENLSARHREGRTAKYLERPMLEAVQGMQDRMARVAGQYLERPH